MTRRWTRRVPRSDRTHGDWHMWAPLAIALATGISIAAGPVTRGERASGAARIARHGMTAEDIYRLRVVTALEASADGTRVVYTLETADREKNAYVHSLFEITTDGGAPRALSRKGVEATTPRFSPDGKWLAYLSDRGEGAQIFIAKAGSRRARQVTRAEDGVVAFAWAPDGERLVFVRSDPDGDDNPDPIVIKRTLVQTDGGGFLGEDRSHLWVVRRTGGAAVQITSGPHDDADPHWSPDGRWIAFVSNRTVDPDANDNTDIFLVHPDGSDLHALVTNPGPDGFPVWSHRGDRIAFVGRLRANDYYQLAHLMVAPADGGKPLNLTASLDTWVAADASLVSSSTLARIHWSADDTTLYTTFERRGSTYLAAIPSAGGAPREILAEAAVLDLVRLLPASKASSWSSSSSTVAAAGGVAGRDEFLLTMTDPLHPPEIFRARADGTGLRRLSHVNDELLGTLELSSPSKVTALNGAGDSVESWLYPPLDLDASRKYPLIVYLHGGPQGFDGNWFDTDLENQIFPANGYAVLRVNYRGSTSYGEKFSRAIWADWHWREHEDVMASVDAALRLPWLDETRLGIGGWSYGGIMTVWTVGHTDRFKVGVPERFEIDYLSAFGEDMWFAQYLEELGSPFENADLYRKTSPGAYVRNIKTPLFLIANERDGNCPLPQAMQLYQRLRYIGVPTELVVYPGEAHVLTQPHHVVDRMTRLLRWFGAYLR